VTGQSKSELCNRMLELRTALHRLGKSATSATAMPVMWRGRRRNRTTTDTTRSPAHDHEPSGRSMMVSTAVIGAMLRR